MPIDRAIVVSNRITVPASELTEQFVRASGPGGQHVNKVSTAVQLRFDAANSSAISQEIKNRLIRLAGNRATNDGVIVIEASDHRSQERNRIEARERLAGLIRKAAEPPPPPRKKTRPSKGAVERRLKAKANRSGIKKMRGRVQEG